MRKDLRWRTRAGVQRKVYRDATHRAAAQPFLPAAALLVLRFLRTAGPEVAYDEQAGRTARRPNPESLPAFVCGASSGLNL